MSPAQCIAMLMRGNSLERIEAAESLGAMVGTPEIVNALIAALQDKNGHVRTAAAESLGKLGPAAAQAVSVLRTLLQDSNAGVQDAATQALAKLIR